MKSQCLNLYVGARLVMVMGLMNCFLVYGFATNSVAADDTQEVPEVELYQDNSGESKINYSHEDSVSNNGESLSQAELEKDSSYTGSMDVDLYQDKNGEWKVRYIPLKDQTKTSVAQPAQKQVEPQLENTIHNASKDEHAKASQGVHTKNLPSVPVMKQSEHLTKEDQVIHPVQQKNENLKNKVGESKSPKEEVLVSQVVFDKENEDLTSEKFTTITENIESALSDDDWDTQREEELPVPSEIANHDVAVKQVVHEKTASEVVKIASLPSEKESTQEIKSDISGDEKDVVFDELMPSSNERDKQSVQTPKAYDKSSAYEHEVSYRNSKHRFEIGTDVFHHTFEQDAMKNNLGTTVAKTNDGTLYGLHAGYEYVADLSEKVSLKDMFWNLDDVNRYKVTLDYRTGPVNYSDINNVPEEKFNHQMLEARAVGGYDFKLIGTRLTPYIGLGYRYQLDPSGEIIDAPTGQLTMIATGETFSSVGFDVRQPFEVHTHYLYLPVGIMTSSDVTDSISIGFNVELDVLLWGLIKSDFADIGTLYTEDAGDRTLKYKNINNSLKGGLGLRGSTRITKKEKKFDWYVEPYIRYWHINESDKEQFPLKLSDGGDVVLFKSDLVTPYDKVQPESSTTEYGVQIGVSY